MGAFVVLDFIFRVDIEEIPRYSTDMDFFRYTPDVDAYAQRARPVSRTHTCKRCGSTSVTWMKTRSTGKFYLAEVFTLDGDDVADRQDFHSTYCGSEAKHREKQAELTAPPEHEQVDPLEIEMLAKLASYTPAMRRSQIEEMRLALDHSIEVRQPKLNTDKLAALIDMAEDFINELEDQ